MTDDNEGNDYFRFVEYHGGIDKQNREENKRIFNQEENKYQYVRIV
jgi:hypothetical protein